MDAAEPDVTTIKGEETVVHSRAGFTPPTPAELAARFPHLEVIELLGHGGMGVVYKGRQMLLDRLVAIKVLRPDLQADGAFKERFLREARTLAKLRHPFIVTVFDVLEAQGFYGLVMEYVEGASLCQRLEAGSITQRDVLDFVPQMTEALQHAHEAGVVHRDIKPENVLVDSLGRVRLVDFGLAALFSPEVSACGPDDDRVVGTFRYMAPEQITMPQAVDHRADIYSTGVVCYEMLTREFPGPDRVPPSRKAATDPRLDPIVLRARARAGSPLPGSPPDASRHDEPLAHARVERFASRNTSPPRPRRCSRRGPTPARWPTGMRRPTISARPSARWISRSAGSIASACCCPASRTPNSFPGNTAGWMRQGP